MTTTALAPAVTTTTSLRRAGFVSRVLADGVDFVIVELLFALGLFGVALAKFLVGSEPFELPRPYLGITSTTQYLLVIAYLAWGWSSTGRTPGKAMFGLRAVTDRGRPLTRRRAVARAALCAFFPFVILWALVSKRNAGLHDLLLDTAVVYDWQPRRPRTQAA
jgi:uncharacterized RDD family membrane protein YckC